MSLAPKITEDDRYVALILQLRKIVDLNTDAGNPLVARVCKDAADTIEALKPRVFYDM